MGLYSTFNKIFYTTSDCDKCIRLPDDLYAPHGSKKM